MVDCATLENRKRLYQEIVFGLMKLNFSDFLSFLHCPPEGMPTNFTNQEVVMSELICLLVESSMYGTVYQILSVLLVLLFSRDILELLIILMSF